MRYDDWLEHQPGPLWEETEAAVDAYRRTQTNPYSLDIELVNLGHGDYEIKVSDDKGLIDIFDETDAFERFMADVAERGGQELIDSTRTARLVHERAQEAARQTRALERRAS